MTTDPAREPFLLVYLHGEQIAEITRSAGKIGRLRYIDHGVPMLSTAMSPTIGRHPWKALGPWIEGLLPERPELLMQWRRQFGIRDQSPLSLLAYVGEECAGAARFIRPDRISQALGSSGLRPLSEAKIAAHLRVSLAAGSPATDEQGRFSLAGAQAKITLYQDTAGQWFMPTGDTPTTHIIKPVIPGMPGQELTEHMMLTAARGVGLSCATSVVTTFEGVPTVVVRRYDRIREGGSVRRVHQEDFTQALGLLPSRKYQSRGGPGPVQIVDHLRAHVAPAHAQHDVERFVQALIFNWLTLGTDAHAKNYSLLLDRNEARLAPLYDLNSYLALEANPHAKMSMRIGVAEYADAVARADWTDLAVAAGVDEEWLMSEIRRQAEVIPSALLEVLIHLREDGVDISGSPLRLVEAVVDWTGVAVRNVTG